MVLFFLFFSSRRRHTSLRCDGSSDVCSSDLPSTFLVLPPCPFGVPSKFQDFPAMPFPDPPPLTPRGVRGGGVRRGGGPFLQTGYRGKSHPMLQLPSICLKNRDPPFYSFFTRFSKPPLPPRGGGGGVGGGGGGSLSQKVGEQGIEENPTL